MKYLQVNTKVLTIILFILFLLPSCNNEEIFVIEESAIIVEEPNEETTNTEDEDQDPEDEVIPIEAVDDTVNTMQHVPVDIEAYLNDKNLPESITLSNTNTSNGVLSINNNETPANLVDDTVVYTPNAGFSGIDSFEYTICDATNAENCDTALVTINIEPIEEDIATELKAFPSAYGDGAYTTGGRGGVVLHVNTLDGGVSNTDATHGSLRWAFNENYPRIIVFDVSGVITVTGGFGINGDVTIAGQTAPEGGITIDGDRGYINSVDNLICRYIRFKGGKDISNDALSVVGNITNQIWDHCSFGFGTDEGASFYSGSASTKVISNVTIQRCLWNENVKGAIIGNTTSGTEVPPTMSFLSNMFYNSGYRCPNIASNSGGKFDVINNVSWNIADRVIRANGSFDLNHIGNYYKHGIPVRDNRTNLFGHGYSPQIYNSNNKFIGTESTPLTYTMAEMTADGDKSWGFFQDNGSVTYGDRLPSSYFTSIQHPLLGVTFTLLTADEALTDVMNNVGCNARLNADGSISENFDTLDANALANVIAGKMVSKIAKSAYDVPAITSVTRPTGYDTDRDGMPDNWETANGFNPNVADDSEDADNDGYTNIEEFLNKIDK